MCLSTCQLDFLSVTVFPVSVRECAGMCVCAFVYICIYICIYIYIYICMCVCVCVSVCMYVSVCVSVYVCASVRVVPQVSHLCLGSEGLLIVELILQKIKKTGESEEEMRRMVRRNCKK